MKKGQSEMLGLTVIVILLVISLLFYITFKSSSQSDTELLRSSIRANNVLNAVLLVDIDGKQMKDLLKECTDCTNQKAKLIEIFNNILSQNQKYKFVAFKDTERFSLGENCDNFVSANPARFPDGYRYEFKLCYS